MKLPTAEINTPHRAAVITGREIAYGNGVAIRAREGMNANLPAVLNGTLDRFTPHSSIVLEGVTVAQLAEHSAGALAAGWNHGKVDVWTVFHRLDGRTVSVGVRDEMRPFHLGVLFDKSCDPGVLAMRLDRYHQITGSPWRGTCAMSALNAIRLTWRNESYQPLWRKPRVGVRTGTGPLIWRRDLTGTEQWWGYVHTFDANAAYLGSAVNAELGWRELEHTGPQLFDDTLPGYWHLELGNTLLEDLRDSGRPPLLRAHAGQAWLTTPYVKFLHRHGYSFDVVDSWTAQPRFHKDGRPLGPAGTRITRRWAESVRNGIVGVDTAGIPEQVVRAGKRTYTDAVGAMQGRGMRIERADWGETIIDLWRSTLYDRILSVYKEIGYWPVRVYTDSVSYADSNPDPAVLAGHIGVHPRGEYRLGYFRHTATMTVEQWQAKHEKRARKAGV